MTTQQLIDDLFREGVPYAESLNSRLQQVLVSMGADATTVAALFRDYFPYSTSFYSRLRTGLELVGVSAADTADLFSDGKSYKASLNERLLYAFANAGPASRVLLAVVHTDSRGRGVKTAERGGADAWPSYLYQWVQGTGVTADNGYTTLTPGLSQQYPLQGAATYESIDYLSPHEQAVQRVYDAALAANVQYDRVILIGSHWGGEQITSSNHVNFHLPFTVSGMEEALAYAEATYPGVPIDKVVFFEHGINDISVAVAPATIRTAVEGAITALSAVTGWSDAKFVGISATPEIIGSYNPVGETATRIPFLAGTGYWCQIPTGLGQLHEGDTYTPGLTQVRTAGYDHMGRVASVALGFIAPTSPNLTITDNFAVTETLNTPVSLGIDQPAYFSVHTGSGSLITLSADLSAAIQNAGPTGGAWPAFDAGTPANNTRAYTLDYVTGDRATGSITRHVVIEELIAVTYLAYDNFNRADTTPATSGGLGTTSGDGATGGGLTWVQDGVTLAGISSNKAILPWDGGAGSYNKAGVDVGAGNVSVRCTLTVAAGQPTHIFAAGTPTNGHGVFMQSDGTCYLYGGFGSHSFGTFTAPGAGTFEFGIDVDVTADTATFYLDGVAVLGPVQTGFADDLGPQGTYCGIGKIYFNDGHSYDNFTVVALP